MKVKSLQEEITNLLQDKADLEDEKHEILEVLELLKAKYQTILNDKISQNEDLIKVGHRHITGFIKHSAMTIKVKSLYGNCLTFAVMIYRQKKKSFNLMRKLNL